jgi:FkbM family methyltransferase
MIYAVRAQYERELIFLHRLLEPGMLVIDGGASCGIYTAVAARLVGPSGRVLSFEPGAEAFSALTKNIEINHLTNVRAHCAALSDTEGGAHLYHHEHGSNSFSLGHPGNAMIDSEPVVTRTLDEVFREEDARRLGLIKLDVEGAEELVLRGSRQTIALSCPTILFEVNAAAAMQLGLQPYGAWELLRNWGYRFFSLAACGALRELDKPPTVDTIDNVIAVHGKRCKS